ncbi:MAG: fibronectin type III domain-containing protein [Planctomycetota bacterium]
MTQMTLSWTAAPAEFFVTKYKVYGTLDGGMQQVIGETGDTTYLLENLDPGNWVFNVSAVNLAGEGPQSDPVSGPALPPKTDGLTLTVEVV